MISAPAPFTPDIPYGGSTSLLKVLDELAVRANKAAAALGDLASAQSAAGASSQHSISTGTGGGDMGSSSGAGGGGGGSVTGAGAIITEIHKLIVTAP